MENQHRKIAGYGELSQAEIDLMNKIKALGPQLDSIVAEVKEHLQAQEFAAYEAMPAVKTLDDLDNQLSVALERMAEAEPHRWLAMARTDLQVGLMKLTRAVAQPSFF
jgi:hypothetical protein